MTAPLLTMEAVSELLAVPIATLRYWRHTGYGPPGFRVGAQVRYRQDEVEEWIDEQRRADADSKRSADRVPSA